MTAVSSTFVLGLTQGQFLCHSSVSTLLWQVSRSQSAQAPWTCFSLSVGRLAHGVDYGFGWGRRFGDRLV